MRSAAWLCLCLAAACAGRADAPPAPSARDEVAAPVPPPSPGSSGCVESEPLKQFVLALEGHRQRSREAALAALGGSVREYESVLDDSMALSVGQVQERNGQRQAVVAQLALAAPPRVPLLRRGNRLHPLDERPRAHPVPLRVCGVNACPGVPVPALPPRSMVLVPLPADAELGPALPLQYDFWWAQVSYDRKRSCPAPPAAAAARAGVVSSGAH